MDVFARPAATVAGTRALKTPFQHERRGHRGDPPTWTLGPNPGRCAVTPPCHNPLAAAVAPPTQGGNKPPEWKIEIRGTIDPTHPDYVDDATAVRLLEQALDEVWPSLSTAERIIARDITFVVNHAEHLRGFMGFSAEDDPEYIYGDTELYPEGSIKANLTTKFVKALQLSAEVVGETAAANIAQVVVGSVAFKAMVIRHELRHAHQYMTGPIHDYGRMGTRIPTEILLNRGIPPKHLLLGQAAKINYEVNAIRFTHEIILEDPEAVEAFTAAVKTFAADPARAADFDLETGRYRLVAPGTRNSFVDRYLVEELKQARDEPGFGPKADLIYNGQAVPGEVLHDLHQLVQSLDANSDREQVRQELAALDARWTKYVRASGYFRVLSGLFPVLRVTKTAFRVEAHALAERVDALGWDRDAVLGTFTRNLKGTPAEAEEDLANALSQATAYNALLATRAQTWSTQQAEDAVAAIYIEARNTIDHLEALGWTGFRRCFKR